RPSSPRRARAAAIVAGTLSLATLAEVHSSRPVLFARLTGRALPLAILAGVCGLAVTALLTAGRPKRVRIIAALGVAAVVWGWGVARYPVLLPGTTVTLSNAGAPNDTLVALVVLFIIAVLLIGPAFVLLFILQGRRLLGAGEPGALAAAIPASRTHPPAATPRQSPPAPERPGTRAAVLGMAVIRRRGRR